MNIAQHTRSVPWQTMATAFFGRVKQAAPRQFRVRNRPEAYGAQSTEDNAAICA